MKPLSSSCTVHYIPHKEIDKAKWDACLRASDHPLIYASSAYLDGMCEQWDALVLNDYEAIMPLPWKRKWGIAYVYSPYFVIAGGVFGKALTEEIVLQFIKAIPHQFLYVDVDLNETDFFPHSFHQNGIRCKERRNTVLALTSSYQNLFTHYSTLAKRKIRKAEKFDLKLDIAQPAAEIIRLYQQHYLDKDVVVEKFDFTNMIALLDHRFAQQTKTYVISFPNGTVCAFYLLMYDEKHVYWLLGGSTEEGKEAGAFYYLTDKVIKDFANSNRIFRFEGSDHDGIHFFNRQFGGTTVFYPRITMNRLPWPIRLLK